MNQYLLTYTQNGDLMAVVTDAQGIADIVGQSHITGASYIKAYWIAPSGIYPVQLTSVVSDVTVRICNSNGVIVESARYCRK